MNNNISRIIRTRISADRINAYMYMLIQTAVLISVILSMPSVSSALIGLKEGEAPNKFTLEDLNGTPVDVGGSFGRKPVIIVFWGLPISKSFLDYSMDELRFLNDFYERHHEATGLEIFGIYTPENDGEVPAGEIEKVRNLVKLNRLKFPVLIDSGFMIFREYGVIALPSTVMIDKGGKIKFIYPSFPLAAQHVFTEEIKGLIGLAETSAEKETEKKKGPDSHSVRLYNYALQMYKKGLPEQALSPLKKSIEMDAEFPLSHNLMGIILWKRGDFEGAIAEFNKAVTLDKTYVPAHFNYGVLKFEGEKYAESEKHLKEALSLNSDMAEAHYVLGLLYKKTNREEEAVRELGTALVLFEQKKTPSVYEVYAPSAFHRISTLYALSELYRKKGETGKALDVLQQAAQLALGLGIKTEKENLHRSRDLMLYE
ncbi:MAG: redoxin domain-containing protein [Nitrospirae bacterium]|nr:redoxin domain-containing protein [Nitrospirota bacterium]